MLQINRRNAFIGLGLGVAVPLLTRAAMAQTTPSEGAGDQSDYVTQTLMTGSVALQTSQVAVEKATDPMVKEFAQLEVGEQTAIATVLSSTEAGATPPALPPEEAEKVQALTDMEAGPEFDAAYVDGQIEGHNKLLEIQKTLSGETEATVEVVTAKLAEQAVTSHLAMLNHIKAQLSATPAT
jgi:putative membrane protein